jgi:tetratricopeptide (TPR) repeat protein
MEALNDFEGALTLLKEYLEHAHRPQSVGLAYYRLGTIERELGNTEVCKACYLRSANLFPPLIPFISNELQNMLQDASGFDSQDFEQEIFDKILTDEGIPLAPTARTSFILYDGATASVDAEVFPVAHDLMRILEAYSGDDVLRSIRNSLEYEPDA